ncbi:hypothetical protein amb0986 [Paramagnetospirillum magneticum AMB-1]|uniref:Uncharacterized protein n=1 Tax=Paramagnetospirillum magneticum (strain ATCC 700264 / AMB-1) TaxID=342108 RepID=Q2W8N5_PARM1|nr:hypothetical protein amb0986 [Paramagnetospirillum magneticum AMB-1]
MLQLVIEFEMIRPAGDAADAVSPRFGPFPQGSDRKPRGFGMQLGLWPDLPAIPVDFWSRWLTM